MDQAAFEEDLKLQRRLEKRLGLKKVWGRGGGGEAVRGRGGGGEAVRGEERRERTEGREGSMGGHEKELPHPYLILSFSCFPVALVSC